jgi:transcriptional regulator with PAS, ATPase and Fis domain
MTCTRGAIVHPWCSRRSPGLAIVFEGGAPALRLAEVGAKGISIGRGTAVDLFVDDAALSRIHCELSFDGRAYTITDRSKHGSFVDGERIDGRVTVPSFRALRIGESVLTAEIDISSLLGATVDDRGGFIVGPRLRWAEQEILAAARAGSDLLVTGETGTGKEWASKAYHGAAAHPGAPRVAINCAALAIGLVEGELFGHAKGAFDGADEARQGLLEAAQHGTVFLDEIGEIPLDVQPKLLRVLQERAIRRVGEARERTIDVRIVAATNGDLEGAIAMGKFRFDLYSRIANTTVHLPALRDRIEDLAYYVSAELAVRKAPPPAASLVEAVLLREWEGNARELSMAIAKAARSAQQTCGSMGPPRVGAEHLPPGPTWCASQPCKGSRAVTSQRLTEAFLRTVLDANDNNVSATAHALGVHRNTVHRYIARFGLRLV